MSTFLGSPPTRIFDKAPFIKIIKYCCIIFYFLKVAIFLAWTDPPQLQVYRKMFGCTKTSNEKCCWQWWDEWCGQIGDSDCRCPVFRDAVDWQSRAWINDKCGRRVVGTSALERNRVHQTARSVVELIPASNYNPSNHTNLPGTNPIRIFILKCVLW